MVTLSPISGWTSLAGFEVDEHAVDAVYGVSDPGLSFRISGVPVSPPGKKWFRLSVEMTKGERRAMRTAWAVLESLKQSAEAGHLPGFRVIHGNRLLSAYVPDDQARRRSTEEVGRSPPTPA